MSTSDRILLILHIGFAIFTLGPLTAATMSTPRYIRHRNATVVRYLNRTTQIYGAGTLLIFLFGLWLAKGELAHVWLSASMTLFIVALVLLLIVERDQRKAAKLLDEAGPAPAAVAAAAPQAEAEAAAEAEDGGESGAAKTTGETPVAARPAAGEVAQVERGRIAAISGVIALIWLVILVLMVWNA
ncbi:hypothetical protein [Actinomadura montaniterrae]|uniref:DUF2269 family protein n=1 Tax=Actinomadura montaniterrae TaxID=1803903 RepID=A0A6L3VQ30_9ACTN|nr:hypothetical protein [Actinomadura montaniterrae]KAB2378897.1 hypothetical protein F9B16_23020 [Actinomadura montaniterrae]